MDNNHSTVYTSANIFAHPSVQLTRGGLILIGLLSGGDYHQAGLPRCGPGIAHGLAKCGLGDELLKATQSLSHDELPGFLTTWREELRSELHTNACGHLGSKKPSLAKAVPDSFPDVNVLLSYTNPIISATDATMHHTPPRWEHEPDLGKLAHLCELHFEWGLKDVIIKRFRTIVWPSIVLRALRRSALEFAADHESHAERDQDVSGTPSKLLARRFSSMGFGAHDTDDGSLQDFFVKIHSSRTHAYTDNILEYRVEVAPTQLVRLASAGIQGLRKPVDTMYDVLPSESEDESGRSDTGRRRKNLKKRGSNPPPEPDSHLRVWMPACMVRPALPELVEQYQAEVEAKRAKKSKRKQRVPPATKAKINSPSKRKAVKPAPPPVDSDAEEFDINVSYSSEDEEGGCGESSPPLKTRMQEALPVASLGHSQHPNTIRKCPTQRDYISPSKVLQRLDNNLGSTPLPLSAPSPAHERPAPTSALQPFPMAFEDEESSDDSDGDNENRHPNHSLQTPFAAFHAQLRASTPPPLPRHPVIPQEEGKPSSDDKDDPDMMIADLPVLANTRDLRPERATAHPTLPRGRPSRHGSFSPPPTKKARKGDPDEGRFPCAETSIFSISSSGSDDLGDGLALAPLLVARSRTFVPRRVVASSEVIDLT